MIGWLATVPEDRIEAVFLAMRTIRDVATNYDREYKAAIKIIGSRIPMGGGHFDLWLRGYALFDFLGRINKGDTPEEAAEYAKAEAAFAVKKWNANPRAACINSKHELHRWPQTSDAMLESAARSLLVASGRSTSVTA